MKLLRENKFRNFHSILQKVRKKSGYLSMDKAQDGSNTSGSILVLVMSVDSNANRIAPSFVVRKKAIDMTKIRTVGKDNLDPTFSGSTRSL